MRLIKWGLREDLSDVGDITSDAVVPAASRSTAFVVARSDGVVAGLETWLLLAELQAGGAVVGMLAGDGPVKRDDRLVRLEGPTRTLLTIERLGLNLVSRLSGVATLTARYVAAVVGTKAKICDTRKTTPGCRHLEKFAVRIGGGTNHRLALYDGILIKDNHLAAMANDATATEKPPVVRAVELARQNGPKGALIEIEVDSLSQLQEALSVRPEIVLLDNMSVENLSNAVEMRNLLAPGVLLEASGGVNLNTVAAIAGTGVDRISVGALTHSAPALDLALDFEMSGE